MKLVLVLLAATFAMAASSTTKVSSSTTKSSNKVGESFKDWKLKNGKKYSAKSGGKTETDAEKTFKENVAKIAKHNSNPKATYKQTANANADMTPEEIRKSRKGLKAGAHAKHAAKAKSEAAKLKSSEKPFTQNQDINVTKAKQKLKAAMPQSIDYRR